MDTLQMLHEEGSIAWSSMNSVEHLSTLKATVGRFFTPRRASRPSKKNEGDTRPTQRQKTPQVVDSCSPAMSEEEGHGESESIDNVWI